MNNVKVVNVLNNGKVINELNGYVIKYEDNEELYKCITPLIIKERSKNERKVNK